MTKARPLRLIDVDPGVRRQGTTKALMVIDRVKGCPACGQPILEREANEDALLRHGGYGATRRTRAVRCSDDECGWYLVHEVCETRPPRSEP